MVVSKHKPRNFKQRRTDAFNKCLILFKDESFIFVICIFFISSPFFTWDNRITLISTIGCYFLLIKNMSIRRNELVFFIIFFLLFTYVAIRAQSVFFKFLVIIGIPLLLITSKKFILKSFNYYRFIFSTTIVPSIIVFFLVYFDVINLNYNIIDGVGLKEYTYSQYPFLLVPSGKISDIIIPRFHGYYDEPGVVGTISAVLLLSDKFNIKKLINIPIFISGIISFSLAFYLISFVYFIWIFLNSRLKWKVIILIISLIVIPLLIKDTNVNKHIIDRFVSEPKNISNIRTSDSFDLWFDNFLKTPDVFFGLGGKTSQELINIGGSSYKDLIVNYGIIFFLLFSLSVFLYSLKRIKNFQGVIIYLLIFILIIYQRPYITSFFYMFLLFSPLEHLRNLNNSTIIK